jgi:hypothetical protein
LLQTPSKILQRFSLVDRAGQAAQGGTILAFTVKQGVRNSVVDWDSVFP